MIYMKKGIMRIMQNSRYECDTFPDIKKPGYENEE